MADATPVDMIPELEAVGTRINAPVAEGPPDLIPGLVPRQGQLVIAGETEVGKSLVALEICSSLVTGDPLWGQLQPSMVASRIVYILGEHYNEVIQRLWQLTRLPITDNVWLLGPEQLYFDRWLVQNGRPRPSAVTKLQKWCKGADLIVFDPLSAFVTGIDTENDNVQMRLALDTMSLVSQTVGASCIILAHQGKPMVDNRGNEHARTSYAIRGASAIEDAATNIFYLGKAHRGESNTARDGDPSNLFCMKKRKYKGAAPDQYMLLRDNATKCHTLLGARPFVDARRHAATEMVARVQASHPDLSFTEVVAIVATIEQVDPRTIWRYLGRSEAETAASPQP